MLRNKRYNVYGMTIGQKDSKALRETRAVYDWQVDEEDDDGNPNLHSAEDLSFHSYPYKHERLCYYCTADSALPI